MSPTGPKVPVRQTGANRPKSRRSQSCRSLTESGQWRQLNSLLPTDSRPLSNLCRRRQAHLLAERGEARIVLVTQDERIEEEV
jgi:hypothetical protein